jgi:hypothetical protein
LSNALLKSFRKKDIRIDPLDETLISALLENDFNGFGIPKNTFNQIIGIYKDISNNINILNYKDLIIVIHYQQQRNVEQHELINTRLSKKFAVTCTKTLTPRVFVQVTANFLLNLVLMFVAIECLISNQIFLIY